MDSLKKYEKLRGLMGKPELKKKEPKTLAFRRKKCQNL